MKKLIPEIFNLNHNFPLTMLMERLHSKYTRDVLKPPFFLESNEGLGLPSTPFSRQLSGGHMRIKFDRMETITTNPNPQGKTFQMTRVIGEALEGKLLGQEWSTKFFQSAQDMHAIVKAAQKGEILDITMKKNGNYLNPVAIEVIDGDTIPVPTAQIGGTCGNKVQERKDNLGIATSIMGPMKAKDKAVDYLMDAASIADLVEDYAQETGAFQFDKETAEKGIPDVDSIDDVKEPGV